MRAPSVELRARWAMHGQRNSDRARRCSAAGITFSSRGWRARKPTARGQCSTFGTRAIIGRCGRWPFSADGERSRFTAAARLRRSQHSSGLSMSVDSAALSVRGLRKHYGDVRAVDGLDLSVARGECFGLLGPNGAGKTTTIEICEGLNAADSGEVTVLGLRWDRDEATLRQRLGIQLQETQLAEKLTVEETVRLFRSFYERRRP